MLPESNRPVYTPDVTAFRRWYGILVLVLFAGFQLEAMMPDQCDDPSRATVHQQDGNTSMPVEDGHLLHTCHCLHVHAVTRPGQLVITIPPVTQLSAPAALASDSAAPPHLPFRPPLV